MLAAPSLAPLVQEDKKQERERVLRAEEEERHREEKLRDMSDRLRER